MRTPTAMALIVFASLSAPAFGQGACGNLGGQCACAVPLASFPPGGAVLSNVQGPVQVTAANPGADQSAAFLNIGDSALVLEDGSASLAFGPSCSVNLPSQSSLVIREINGCACASVVEASTTAGSPGGGGGGNVGPIIGGLLAAGTIGTSVFLIATDDDDDPPPGSPE